MFPNNANGDREEPSLHAAATSLQWRCDVAPTLLKWRCDVSLSLTVLGRHSDVASTTLRHRFYGAAMVHMRMRMRMKMLAGHALHAKRLWGGREQTTPVLEKLEQVQGQLHIDQVEQLRGRSALQ